MNGLAATLDGGQGLLERNPVSHAIWAVGFVTCAALALIVLVEICDWMMLRWKQRAEEARTEPTPANVVVREPDTKLRRRFFRRIRPRRRTSSEREG